MKATLVIISLLGIAYANPIHQEDVFEGVSQAANTTNSSSAALYAQHESAEHETHSSSAAVSAEHESAEHETHSSSAAVSAEHESDEHETNSSSSALSAEHESAEHGTSKENTSESKSSEESNTSEDKTSESMDTTDEDKTSEESESYSREKSDSDENGDTRDNSTSSEENLQKSWVGVFNINLKSEEDGNVSRSASEEDLVAAAHTHANSSDPSSSTESHQSEESRECKEGEDGPDCHSSESDQIPEGRSLSLECLEAGDCSRSSEERSVVTHNPMGDMLSLDDGEREHAKDSFNDTGASLDVAHTLPI